MTRAVDESGPEVRPGQVWKDRHGIAYTVVRLTRQKAEDRR